MPKNIQQLVEEAKKEFEGNFTVNNVTDEEGNRWVSTGAWRIQAFLEAKMREAYKAGALDLWDEVWKQYPSLIGMREARNAFLATLTDV